MLADFGIAKVMGETGEDLTNEHIMMGTAKYLSPEQVRGRPLDGRADIYALGLVLYELFTGKRAFEAMMEMRKIDIAAIEAARRG